MKTEKTNRGFAYGKFRDNRSTCSIQESSNAMKPCIWLGSDTIGLQHFKAEWGGWRHVKEPDEVNSMTEHYVANNRMELDQETVKALLPALHHFVKYGTLPS